MLKASEVIAATGATREDFAFTGITTDSRAVQPGELFVALKGGNFDGHDYCAKAVELGAAGVVISHDIEALPAGVAVFKVEDTLKAYQAMARAYRRQQKKLKVFAITGSNGKTSTKDLLAACLGAKYKVVKTQGNFNNEIGLPLTVFGIRAEHEVAILEMGISDFGEMHRLSEMVQPTICVLTIIGCCHLENLGDRDGVLKAKTEMFDFADKNAEYVLNGDDDKLSTVDNVGGKKPIFFGFSDKNSYLFTALSMDLP